MPVNEANISPPSAITPNTSQANTRPDWLTRSITQLTQDLSTSEKELDIIVFILAELEQLPNNSTGQIELMRTCRKYSKARCHRLRERLRQVQLWAQAGRDGVPEEWKRTDDDWQRWLSEQTRSYSEGLSSRGDRGGLPASHEIVWGPLLHILDADVWWRGL